MVELLYEYDKRFTSFLSGDEHTKEPLEVVKIEKHKNRHSVKALYFYVVWVHIIDGSKKYVRRDDKTLAITIRDNHPIIPQLHKGTIFMRWQEVQRGVNRNMYEVITQPSDIHESSTIRESKQGT